MNLTDLAERGLLPDSLIRMGIRKLLAQRLDDVTCRSEEQRRQLLDELRSGPIAIETAAANDQHYEVPASFFETVLGPRLKYSCCWYGDAPESSPATLDEAEEAMLSLTAERAEIRSGMEILDLGCGWGSLTLWLAEHFPDCRITCVSNSTGQRGLIEHRCRERGLENVRVITANVGELELATQFDRIVSVEMFEHMSNYEALFRNVATWLKPEGKLFVHVFCHRDEAYAFETEGEENWMGRHFFTGGIMPSERLFHEFDDELTVENQWRVSGLHYAQTCEDWLTRLDQQKKKALESLQGHRQPRRALQRWRMFFMACAELFKYNDGDEWFVTHYLFSHQPSAVV